MFRPPWMNKGSGGMNPMNKDEDSTPTEDLIHTSDDDPLWYPDLQDDPENHTHDKQGRPYADNVYTDKERAEADQEADKNIERLKKEYQKAKI